MITTHVLDTALGKPARGVPIALHIADGEAWRAIGNGVTDEDGRLRTLTQPAVEPGTYRLTFDTKAYAGSTPAFFPTVTIHFTVTDGNAHHHVPLLLSPYGYSTYRGS